MFNNLSGIKKYKLLKFQIPFKVGHLYEEIAELTKNTYKIILQPYGFKTS